MSWSATKKEVERSNFFKEVPRILKRYLFRFFFLRLFELTDGLGVLSSFWVPFAVSVVLIAGVVVCSTSLVPLEWRANGAGWGAIFPLVFVFFLSTVMSHSVDDGLVAFRRVTLGCHILFPVRRCCVRVYVIASLDAFVFLQIVLNPWLMIFSY